MDVRTLKCVLGFSALLLTCSCANKSVSGVFPQSDPNNNNNLQSCGGQQIQSRFVVNWEDGHTSVVHAENKELFIEKFLKPNLALVKYVEFDHVITLQQAHSMAASSGSGITPNWGQTITQASSAWSQDVQGAGVKVAVVDAEVDYSNPQIHPRLDVNKAEMNGQTGVDDDGNGLVDDIYGWDFRNHQPQPPIMQGVTNHGTHVAGIIAADHSAGPIQGMAPQATIVPANFMYPSQDERGNWEEGGALGDAVLAIQYVASRGVKVISASWGGDGCDQSLKNAVANLNSQGILFVAAAGNGDANGNGLDLDTTPEFPAALGLPNQLTIAASTPQDVLASFSNSSYHYVHLAAPGVGILSTVPGGTMYMDGTSMATPFVSGAAALLWSDRPAATVAQIRQALMDSVDAGSLRVASQGRLNVQKALARIRQLVP